MPIFNAKNLAIDSSVFQESANARLQKLREPDVEDVTDEKDNKKGPCGKAKVASGAWSSQEETAALSYPEGADRATYPLTVAPSRGPWEMVLADAETNKPVAIIAKNSKSLATKQDQAVGKHEHSSKVLGMPTKPKTFHIYGYEPYFEGQEATTKYFAPEDGQSLYEWATVENVSGLHTGQVGTQHFAMKMADGQLVYRADLATKDTYLVSVGKETSAAIMEKKRNETTGRDYWNIESGPSVDTGLIIAYTFILDEVLQSKSILAPRTLMKDKKQERTN